MLDPESPLSLYHQLTRVLISRIRSGEWKVDERMPTERELCELFGVSRITVRQALEELEREGWIVRRQGKGTFPSPYERFSHEWKIDKIEVPEPPLPPNLPPEIVKQLKENLAQNRYLGRLSVTISWTRAGGKFTAEGETLLRPGQLWLPSEAAP